MTAQTAAPAVDELSGLLKSWQLSLEAARLSRKTITNYLDTGRQLLRFLEQRGMPTRAPGIRREHIEAWMVALLDHWSASTAATRFRCLQQLFKYLVEEGDITESPTQNMRPPKVPEPITPVLSEDEIARLVDIKGRSFEDVRDAALLSVLAETGMRAFELRGLHVDDFDVRAGLVVIRCGKGGRARTVPIGRHTAKVVDRYLRRGRPTHPYAYLPDVWLGLRGPLGETGVHKIVRKRGAQAGVPALHCHMLRHAAAHHFLAAGGRDGDLMQLMGWRSADMVRRYGASMAAERARDEGRRLSLVDRVAR